MNQEWGVKWEALSPALPEEVHIKKSKDEAESALTGSAFPGIVVCRDVTDWRAAA
jgi:hypothetical protein